MVKIRMTENRIFLANDSDNSHEVMLFMALQERIPEIASQQRFITHRVYANK